MSIISEMQEYLENLKNLAPAFNDDFNISRCRIARVLFIKFFTFGYYAFNLRRMLLLNLGDTETNPKPKKSSFIDFFHGM